MVHTVQQKQIVRCEQNHTIWQAYLHFGAGPHTLQEIFERNLSASSFGHILGAEGGMSNKQLWSHNIEAATPMNSFSRDGKSQRMKKTSETSKAFTRQMALYKIKIQQEIIPSGKSHGHVIDLTIWIFRLNFESYKSELGKTPCNADKI